MSIPIKHRILGCAFALLSWSGSALIAAGPTTAPSGGAGLGDVVSAEYAQYEWKNGDKPVRMLKRDEGFCFLTEVSGKFAGYGEVVRVYIGEDGYWYLAGASGQDDLAGKAMSVKFARKVKVTVVPAEDANTKAWLTLLSELSTSSNPDIQSSVKIENKEIPDEADKTIALANTWEKSTRELPAGQRRLVETHVIWLYHRATINLEAAKYEKALAAVEATWLAIVNHQLADFNCWRKSRGQWSIKDGVIEGRGDSWMTLISSMPADCIVQWHMRVVDGMRPRVLFDGSDFYVGNEGFDRTIDAFGVASSHSIPATYNLGDAMKVVVKFSGKKAELFVNDDQIGTYERKQMPREMSISLRGGDDWSTGTTQFWGFKVSPVK